jgi:hypothetical protein
MVLANYPICLVIVFHKGAYWAGPFDLLLVFTSSSTLSSFVHRVAFSPFWHLAFGNTVGLIAGVLIFVCAFRRFVFNWLPPLLLSALAFRLALLTYPKAGSELVTRGGLFLSVAFSAVAFLLFIFIAVEELISHRGRGEDFGVRFIRRFVGSLCSTPEQICKQAMQMNYRVQRRLTLVSLLLSFLWLLAECVGVVAGRTESPVRCLSALLLNVLLLARWHVLTLYSVINHVSRSQSRTGGDNAS